MSDKTPTPGTPEWAQWVAEQKSHPLRDGHAEAEQAKDDTPARKPRAKPKAAKRAAP